MGCGPKRWLAVVASAAALVTARPALGTQFSVDCPRLDASAVEELSARARLVLRVASNEAAQRVVVHCDETRAWLTWDDDAQRTPIDESVSLIEGALDAIEEGLERAQGRLPRPVRRTDTTAPARNEAPDFGPRRTRPPPAPPSSARAGNPGGVGLSVMAELWEKPVTLALGPHFDVAVGSGSYAVVVNGGFMTAPSVPRSAFVVDTQLGLAWGAPYAPRARLGAAIFTGGEWFAGVGPGGTPSADITSLAWVMSLGGRATVLRESSVALWLGLDGRARLGHQRLGSPLNYSLFPVSVLLEIGGFVLVDG